MIHLNDWLTTPQVPIASKITTTMDWFEHDHSFFEIFYILDGTVAHTLNGQTSVLQKGDILFLNPEDCHSFLRESDNNFSHRDIVFRKSFFKSICNFIGPDFFDDYTENRLVKKASLSLLKMNSLEEFFQQFPILVSSNPKLGMASARITCADLLGSLLKTEFEKYALYPKWFDELLSRFEDAALLKEGLHSIISPFFYTNEYICRTFKKLLGVTMTDYLNEKRLNLASNLLAYTKNTILQISLDVGFSSLSYFNKIFKNRYGVTPSEFRKHTDLSN